MTLTLSNIVRTNAIPFIVGATLGVLGTYIVNWIKGSAKCNHQLLGNLRVIEFLDNKSSIQNLSLKDFKKIVSMSDLNELRKSVGWGIRTESKWDEILSTSTNIVCVMKNKKLIGYGCFVGNGRMGTIFDIHVHPDHQRQKIGTIVMNTLVLMIKQKEYAFVGLFGWEDNKTVLKFYEKFGFRPNPHGMECNSENLRVVSNSNVL